MKLNRIHIKIAAIAGMAIIALAGSVKASAFSASQYADTSKLASGKWVKIQVTSTGPHVITSADAQKWGFSDVNKLHIFGYGGAPLSERLSADAPDDLPQIPVLRSEGKIIFYAQGPTTWGATAGKVNYVPVQHPYATAGYYFVTDDARYTDVAINRASNAPQGNAVTTFTERLFHEEELVNPGETGRVLLGEDFRYTKSQSFKFQLPGLVSGSEVNVLTTFASKTMGGNASLTFQQNGTNLPSANTDRINAIHDVAHDHYAWGNIVKSFVPTGGENLTYTVNYNPSGTVYMARLNYIAVNYERTLALSGGTLAWGQYAGTTSMQYRLGGMSAETQVWDVTTSHQPTVMNVVTDGGTGAFSPIASGNREYVAFNPSASLPSPIIVGAVANQSIHSEATPDMIIISPAEYLAQAQRIADMHTAVDSMRVLVLDHKLVFNEFSSGTPDAMAYRKMNKMFYDRGTDKDGHKLGYMLLFGGGSYDNRQLSSAVKSASYPMLLTWQSETSHDENTSHTSDDPFAVLADNSGPAFAAFDLDIAVGRFPIKSVAEARTTTDKLIKYVTTPANGAWKTNVLDVADDENQAIHMKQAEDAINIAKQNGGADFVFNKVYMDAFNAVSQGAGRTYPDARAKMFHTLNEGTVWWNYTGHASPNGWTGEGQLTRPDIAERLFYKRLPILYAATCEFTRFDALETSGGESMFLNGQGGAIALICPPRLVYIGQNGQLHRHVAKYAFARDAEGMPNRLGDILRLGKNAYRKATTSGQEDNNLRYFLFGDPAMRPAYAPLNITIESINGQAVSETSKPEFQARQTLTFAGKVTDSKGKKVDFNGPVIATLYDCEQSVLTHGWGTEGEQYTYLDRNNKLGVKVDSVKNGEFTVKMTVPSEILATFDNYSPSLINLYAYDNSMVSNSKFNGGSLEAMGSNSQFYIYGYDDTVVADTIGPNIEMMALNSSDFQDGDLVNESPLMMARVSDASGINLSSSGIGHAITLTLDDKTTINDVSAYFTPINTGEENGSAGNINYQFADLEPGAHTLKLKVWDVFNNSSSRTINFTVIHGLKPDLYLKHNRPDATITIGIDIFDMMGRLVWTTTQTGRSDSGTSFPVTWNLTDMNGSRVQRGIYIYRARISTDGIQEATKAKKIAVTAQ
ncbi:MAG: type IX secretion system sortase PorU [Bacteroidales bacterium]|nr:type IX secretion system sortase PorU [Bacteroidales bacterium]